MFNNHRLYIIFPTATQEYTDFQWGSEVSIISEMLFSHTYICITKRNYYTPSGCCTLSYMGHAVEFLRSNLCSCHRSQPWEMGMGADCNEVRSAMVLMQWRHETVESRICLAIFFSNLKRCHSCGTPWIPLGTPCLTLHPINSRYICLQQSGLIEKSLIFYDMAYHFDRVSFWI